MMHNRDSHRTAALAYAEDAVAEDDRTAALAAIAYALLALSAPEDTPEGVHEDTPEEPEDTTEADTTEADTLNRAAFAAYQVHTGGARLAWEDLTPTARDGWGDVARAALRAALTEDA